jgi:hypothetical protein
MTNTKITTLGDLFAEADRERDARIAAFDTPEAVAEREAIRAACALAIAAEDPIGAVEDEDEDDDDDEDDED